MTPNPLWGNPLLSSVMKDSNLLAGFININTINSGNPEVEQKILNDVAGYGRQLGRIMDVMKILMERMDENDSKKEAVIDLKKLIGRIEEEKYRMDPTSITPQNVDQAISAIEELGKDDK